MTELVQVAIVGGGPAGLSAAISAAGAGARVVLLDEQSRQGGRLRYRLAGIHDEYGNSQFPPKLAASLVERAVAVGVDIRASHRVWGLFPGNELGVESGGVSTVVRAERILLCNGSIDRSLPFPGGSLPGVFTARAVQILLNVHFVRPGRRFAIVADEPETTELTYEVEAAGGSVVATFPATADGLSASGDTGVTHIVGDGLERDVDVVVVAAGRVADSGLALMAECAAGYLAELGGFVPKVDRRMQTTVAGLYVAGDCAGPTTAEIALAEGEYAGVCIAASLGLTAADVVAAARERYLRVDPSRSELLARVTGSFVQVDRVPMGVDVR